MNPPASRYADLTREELAVVVPELLLIGHLIDRAGMAWCISAFGREEMVQIAIEEWAGASPIYTRRMQQRARVRTRDAGRRRRGHDLQGPAARHRRTTAVHGLPLHGARRAARRVPARPLRRPDGRRADGRGVRRRDVPRHRGPDVRRHRHRHPPPGSGTADPPPATRAGRPAATLRMDRDHRRLLPRGRSRSPPWRSTRGRRRRRSTWLRSTLPTTAWPTTPAPCSPTWTSRRSPGPRWPASPTRCASRWRCWTTASRSRGRARGSTRTT